ncbi:MAG: MaoC family dehydratase [Burkholderiales bacterium]|nr:MaoC family dehydratase [Burkholderiales bacterium]
MGLRTAASIRIGEELPPLTKPIAQRQIDAYSGVRPHSIHTDPEWARQKGFAAPLAQGMMSTAYVSQMMVQFLGEGFVRGGRMSVAFIKPVLAGDTLTMHGSVRSKDADGAQTRVSVEFWCENQQGVKTMVGTASGLAA